MAGCRKDDASTASVPDANEVKEKVAEAADATGAFLTQQSRDFLNGAQETYSQLEGDTQQLLADLKESGKEGWETMSAELEQQRNAAQQKLNELKAASQENWEDTKEAYETAVEELKDTYQKTKAQYDEPKDAGASSG
jgi:histidinol dehydrogenase